MIRDGVKLLHSLKLYPLMYVYYSETRVFSGPHTIILVTVNEGQ